MEIDSLDNLIEVAKCYECRMQALEAEPPAEHNLIMDWSWEDEDSDELLDEAIALVAEAKKASASLLQRRLKVGYARAARLLDLMEAAGLIGPGDGAKPREVNLEKIEERLS
jgi:DNA segregation ATPase FtsK/SpoIIIE-like protein